MQQTTLPSNHKIIVDRFVAACQADARVVGALLGGSYATDTADAHSDLDLYVITTDEAYEEFIVEKEAFIQQLGEPLFLEDWGKRHFYFFILADGTEGEVGIGQASRFQQIHGGTYVVLVDKQDILAGVDFPSHAADPLDQSETLRQLIMNFWHEVGHFNKALARGQLWFAYGSLETMRHICVNLARLRHNFADANVGAEPYFKLEQAMPVAQVAPLQATFCPLEAAAIRRAGFVLLQFYRETATVLAETHGLIYPAELERLMTAPLETVDKEHLLAEI